jgi:hypothetical protein
MMKMPMKVFALAVLAGMAAGVSAADPAAVVELRQIRGTVLVNQGNSYVTAQEGMRLNLGDQVMVMEGSHAVVSYGSDGCAYNAGQNTILRVRSQSACAVEQGSIRSYGPNYSATSSTLGGSGVSAGVGDGSAYTPGGASLGTGTVVAAGAVVTAGAIAATEDSPVSDAGQ